MDEPTREAALRRLRKIGGQVEGLARMVESDRTCVDVLLQIAAVQAALGRVGTLVLGSHVETCVADALASGAPEERQQKIDELLEVFSRYGQIRAR